MVEQILEQVGFIGDRKSFCKLYNIKPKRLDVFLRTKRAMSAAEKATDLSRSLYYENLKRQTIPEDQDMAVHAAPLTEEDWIDEGLTIRKLGSRDRPIERDSFELRKTDLRDSAKWLRKQGCELSKSELKYWNDKANGK